MTADVDILIADDRAEDLLAITEVLTAGEYNLVTAQSGAAALRRVLERDFAVILLDVMMPDLDGIEVARIIKQRERSRDTPILFLTAAGTEIAFIYRAYSVGAIDYLLKPIDPDVLRAKVAIFADLFRKDRRIRQQADALREADRRKRELELAEVRLSNERRYRNLAEAIPQIVWTADRSGAVTYLNRRWVAYTGRIAAEASGWGWLSVVHPDDAEAVEERWREALATEGIVELECRLRAADGGYRWHLTRAVPEHDADGTVVGWLGTHTDVNDRRRAFDAAEEAVHARDEFLSIASHELRTPLTTLKLRLQSLSKSLQAKDGRDVGAMLASAERQSNRLEALVEDLLDVSRITSGRLALRRERFDLVDAAREVIGRFTELAAESGCSIALCSEGPAVGVWDRGRVEQILQNLLSNAVRHAGGEVEVAVEAKSGVALLRVRDHGPGIAAEDVERIFGQFERAAARHYGGLGLGLYIARQVAAAHGGSIDVDSPPGEGATFTVALPVG